MLGSEIQQIPGVYHRKIGDIVVTALSDGYLELPLGIVRNLDSGKAQQLLRESFRPSLRISVNAFLIRSKNRCALVDTGSGDYLQKSAGGLANSLLAAGVDSATIDTVLLTHMHPDHSAGLTHMPSGTRNFPNAELVLHAKELRHWFDDAAMSRADEQTRSLNFRAGREQVAPYAKQTRLFEKGEVFPGVTAIPSPGHTPGHTAYLVASRTDQLLIWGDTVHVPELQTAFPDATVVFDTDRAVAAESRKQLFDRIASDNILVAGMHLHFPSFGRLSRRDDGSYRFFPEAGTHDV